MMIIIIWAHQTTVQNLIRLSLPVTLNQCWIQLTLKLSTLPGLHTQPMLDSVHTPRTSHSTNVGFSSHSQSHSTSVGVRSQSHSQSHSASVGFSSHSQSHSTRVGFSSHSQSHSTRVEFSSHSQSHSTRVGFSSHSQSHSTSIGFSSHSSTTATLHQCWIQLTHSTSLGFSSFQHYSHNLRWTGHKLVSLQDRVHRSISLSLTTNNMESQWHRVR